MECSAAASTPLIFTHHRFRTTSLKPFLFLFARRFYRNYQLNRGDVLHPLWEIRCLSQGRLDRKFPVNYAESFRLFSPPLTHQCLASSSGGGGGDTDDGAGRGDGGGDGSSDRTATTSLPVDADEVPAVSSEVIVLDVGGMSCGGCAASVKRILESQPQVSSANVNLATETAVIWPVPEVRTMHNWKQQLGEKLAAHLTTSGFKSNIRISSGKDLNSMFEKKREEKMNLLRRSGRNLAVSWALCAVCLFGHVLHFLGANMPSWIHSFHSVGFHMSLSLVTLVGPGRWLIYEGIQSLLRGVPNMNTLVSLGAISSFIVSSISVLLPKLGWKTFFEEPIMLIAFVLLGRNLEQRAKIKATSDMTGLMKILPKKARLIVDHDMDGSQTVVDVPCGNLCVGDKIIILPGDRVPVDGIVTAGRSSVDESSFTGEPLPVTKLSGNEVNAGSININGTLTVEVRRSGGESHIADIVRMVSDAQNREASIQRIADKVAGYFTYGVMAFSAMTFLVWNSFGPQLLPAVFQSGGSVSLALQLSCSVLVIACPCALGLATPTAVLVGTSLGATRGMLIRGGDVLEKLSLVDTIVFDKTGTLTTGRPTVTKVVALPVAQGIHSKEPLGSIFSETDILRLAAGVESNSNHPVGRAITEAARMANCTHSKAANGSYREEPGFGAVALVEHKEVVVGTADWLFRNGVVNNAISSLQDLQSQSLAYVGVDGSLVGLIYIEDTIREDAADVIKSITKMGINAYMLSGDKELTATSVASIVGIPKHMVISGVKPEGKLNFIRKLQQERKLVAMVGDGINDAAALASAEVGVAVGGALGVASEASSVVLMGDRLTQLVDALELSRLTMKTVKQNLWWAFAYNIVGIPIAAGLLLPYNGTMLTPSFAGAMMGLSSLGVMANSLLLRLKYGVRRKLIYKFPPDCGTSSGTTSPLESNSVNEIYTHSWKEI